MSEFVTVGIYPQSFLAHAAKNFLEERGMRAFVSEVHDGPKLVELCGGQAAGGPRGCAAGAVAAGGRGGGFAITARF